MLDSYMYQFFFTLPNNVIHLNKNVHNTYHRLGTGDIGFYQTELVSNLSVNPKTIKANKQCKQNLFNSSHST